jgi:hypothetical protein
VTGATSRERKGVRICPGALTLVQKSYAASVLSSVSQMMDTLLKI